MSFESFEGKIRWISAFIVHPKQLTSLKYRFKNDINSKRKYSQIDSFHDLVGILLTRGLISHEDVTVLDQICQEYFKVNFSEIPDSLSNASSSSDQRSQQLPFTAAVQATHSSGLTNGNHASGGNSTDKELKTIPTELIKIIVTGNITEKQWRPFVRALQVDTESISHEPTTADKVLKALTIFLQNTEQCRQWCLLEHALEKIHRIDLREQCRAALASC